MRATFDAALPDPLLSLRQTNRLTRAELYEAVWQVPVGTLAPHLAISSRGLGKLCERFEIPRPSRGHRQKTAAGKRVRRPKLPVSEALSSDLAVITRGSIDARRREQARSGSEDPIVEFWQTEVARQRRARRAALDEERKARRARLMAAARAHRDAQELQAFIGAVRFRAQQTGLVDGLDEWEAWAGQVARDLDPIGSEATLAALMADHETRQSD